MTITAPISIDADDLRQIGYASLQAAYPDWNPANGDMAARMISAFAEMVAEALTPAGDVPDDIIRFVGTVVYRTAPFPATSATVASTWTLADNAGHTITAGTNVALAAADGTLIDFQVQDDVTVPAGNTATSAGEVILVAAAGGTDANALTGAVELVAVPAWVQSAVTVGSSSGGTDEETTNAYTTRVEQLAQLIAPRPILPEDFANAVRLLVPGVQRALAIDQLDGSTGATGQERCVTVFPVDAAGANVSGGIKTAAQALLASMRETTFEAFVEDPTRTTINISFTGKSLAGYDPTDVQARAIAAATAAVSPAFWGVPPTGDLSQWVDRPVVRFQDIVTALNNVDGFDYYTALTINGGTADITMTGPAALPTPGTISGTVTAP